MALTFISDALSPRPSGNGSAPAAEGDSPDGIAFRVVSVTSGPALEDDADRRIEVESPGPMVDAPPPAEGARACAAAAPLSI